MESRQHFICTEAVPIFVFSMTSRQHFICTEVAPTLAFIMELEVSRRMPPRLWHCKELSLRLWRCKEMPTKPWSFKKNVAKTLTLHGHALGGEMMQHQLQMLEKGEIVQILETWCETIPLRRKMMWFKFLSYEATPLQKYGRISIKDGQCHEDFISCKRSWRFCFTPQPSINLCSLSF